MAGKNDQAAAVASLKKQCDDCCKQLAALKKEVASLKRELSKKSSGGADPRVDKLVEVLLLREDDGKDREKRRTDIKKAKEVLKSV